MNQSPIYLIASDANLRLSLCSILQKAQFSVANSAYLCPQEIQSQAASYALFVYAIHSTHDANLACNYLQNDICLTTPIIFLCAPVFAPLLEEAMQHCCRVKILITPLDPEQIISTVYTILDPALTDDYLGSSANPDHSQA